MLILDSTSDLINVVTSAAVTVDVQASWVDWDGTTALPQGTETAITTAATTTVVAAPAAAHQVTVKTLSIRNKHASSSNTITVNKVGAGPVTYELFKVTLLAGETLLSREGVWFRYDANGGVYTANSAGVDPHTNDFRLTGVTATPVMTTDSTTLSTIYAAPYKGTWIALYDGTNWQLLISAEVSLAVSGRTTDLPFDIFAYSNAGVLTLEFLDWTSATARATGLVRQDGVWTKSGDATRRYLGSCRPRSATSFHFVQLGSDLPAKADLWNADNRLEMAFTNIALTNTWAYTTATWRQAQASANYQFDFMVGLQEENVEGYLATSSRNSTISIPRQCGIGYDVTNAIAGTGWACITAATANTVLSIEASQIGRLKLQPGIGRHFLAWLEISTATGTCTWVGDDGALRLQSGLNVTWVC